MKRWKVTVYPERLPGHSVGKSRAAENTTVMFVRCDDRDEAMHIAMEKRPELKGDIWEVEPCAA